VHSREVLETAEKECHYIASMGYTFSARRAGGAAGAQHEGGLRPPGHPDAIASQRVFGYVFNGYWRYRHHPLLFEPTSISPIRAALRFYDETIHLHPQTFPAGSKVENCDVHYSLISDGSIIQGGKLANTVVGLRSVIRAGTYLERVVMMGADTTKATACRGGIGSGIPAVGVGADCVIKNTILDKNVRIGNQVRILNAAGRQFFDATPITSATASWWCPRTA